jgi:SAM-dependent MidA family methyltransferase
MNRLYRLQTVSVDLADDPTAICVCAASGDPGGVKSKIISEIQQVGPLPFERFMAMALYDPDGGFFAAGELRSVKGGDFLTSPEVSPMFGEAIGRLVESEIDRIGEPFRLVEVAAGSGSLLTPLLASVDRDLDAWAVEVSPAAKEALTAVVSVGQVVGSLDEVPSPFRGLILANELIDNLPMAIAQRVDGAWRERWVGAERGDLSLVDADPRPEVRAWLDRFAGPVPDGGMVEVQIAAADWLRQAISMIEEGSIVLFDYGDTAENLLPRRQDGTLRTYRSHHLGPHPLDEPGATDITADVNFSALEAVAVEAGWEAKIWRQDDYLATLGVRERISEMRHRELELARSGDAMERLKVRTRRTEAETLMNPRGLGDFRVLVASQSVS